MRRSSTLQVLIAGLLILAMTASITGLLGASGAAVRITAPAAGAKVSGALTVSASVRGAKEIAYVILGVDGDRAFSTNSTPYSFELDTTALSDGAHRIFVEAYNNYGLIASSKAITIYVRNGTAPMAQGKRTAPARVAAKPATPKPAAGSPITVASAAKSETAAAASPVVSGQGPTPEPSHTPATAAASPATPTAPEASTRASFAAAATTDTPAVERPLPRPRGHTVVLNGRPVRFSPAPYVVKGRMQVGLRAVFEHIGAQVSWHPKERTARSLASATTVEVAAGSQTARVNGRPVDMGRPSTILEERMIIPLAFFAGVTDSAVQWDQETQTASVTMGRRALAAQP